MEQKNKPEGGIRMVLYADMLVAANALTDYFLLRLCAAVCRDGGVLLCNFGLEQAGTQYLHCFFFIL